MFRSFDPFDDFFGARSASRQSGTRWNLAYDVVRFEDHIEVAFDLPGIDPDSIELTVEKGELVLAATRTTEVPEDAKVITRGRPFGEFRRQLHLGDTLDPEGLEAAYDLGVLTLTIPLAPQAQARKVAIGVGSQEKLTQAVTTTFQHRVPAVIPGGPGVWGCSSRSSCLASIGQWVRYTPTF